MVVFKNHGQVRFSDGLVHLVAAINEWGHWKAGCELQYDYRHTLWRLCESQDAPTCLICARLSVEYAVDEGI